MRFSHAYAPTTCNARYTLNKVNAVFRRCLYRYNHQVNEIAMIYTFQTIPRTILNVAECVNFVSIVKGFENICLMQILQTKAITTLFTTAPFMLKKTKTH